MVCPHLGLSITGGPILLNKLIVLSCPWTLYLNTRSLTTTINSIGQHDHTSHTYLPLALLPCCKRELRRTGSNALMLSLSPSTVGSGSSQAIDGSSCCLRSSSTFISSR